MYQRHLTKTKAASSLPVLDAANMAGTPYAFLIIALLALAITLLTGLLRDELLLCSVGYLLTVCSSWQLQRSNHFRFAGGGLISAILRRQSASDS